MSHCNCFDLLKIPTISEENEILVNIVAPHSLQLSRGNFTPDWFLWWPIGTKHFPESKTLPRIQNTSQNPKTLLRIQKHFPESKNTSQNPKSLPRIQNTSQNPKPLHALQHLPESKTLTRIQKHFPEPKTLPTLQNTSQNPKHSPHYKTLPRTQASKPLSLLIL